MAKRRETIEWIIAAAAALGVAYLYHKATTPTTSSSTSLTNPTDTAGGETIPVPAIINPTGTVTTAAVVPLTVAATAGTDLTGANLPSGISQEVYNKVMSWAHGDGRPPVLTMAGVLIPAEYNGMYDIITTQWATGAKATPAQKDFWDNLRGKYDPTHKYW